MMKKAVVLLVAMVISAPAATPQEPGTLSLTLEDSILKALKNNLNVAVEVYNPGRAGATLSKAKEIFYPSLEFSYDREDDMEPSYWWIQGAETLSSTYDSYQASLAQKIPTGGDFSLSLVSYKSDTNQAFQLINPRYGSILRFDFTQPLLKNLGPKVARREIIVAQNNLEISRNQFKSVLMDTIYLVEEAYWELVYAIENMKVKEQSLQLARDLLAKNKKEVQVGQLAPIEILNAQAVVAQREAEILLADAQIKRSELILRNLINARTDAGGKIEKVVPLDRPEFKAKEVSLDGALADAMSKRPDLKVNMTDIDTRKVNFSVAKNQLLPSLDLKLSYWSPGLSGDRLIYDNSDIFGGKIIGKEPGAASDALRDSLKFLYNNWSVGMTLSVPLGDLFSRAGYAQAKLDLEQSEAKLKTIEQQIIVDVSDAVRSIETDAKRVEAYRIARELAEKRLEAEAKKLGVGLTTNYFVLQYQEELANARSNELKALVDYNLSLAKLERSTGTSLESRNISISNYLEK